MKSLFFFIIFDCSGSADKVLIVIPCNVARFDTFDSWDGYEKNDYILNSEQMESLSMLI
jgi:hypothetical protein